MEDPNPVTTNTVEKEELPDLDDTLSETQEELFKKRRSTIVGNPDELGYEDELNRSDFKIELEKNPKFSDLQDVDGEGENEKDERSKRGESQRASANGITLGLNRVKLSQNESSNTTSESEQSATKPSKAEETTSSKQPNVIESNKTTSNEKPASPRPPASSAVELVAQNQRRHQDEDSSNPLWYKHRKHFFILSAAGKPIYSRYGDEQYLASFMASLTAMVSFVADMKDNLRYLVAGDHRLVFQVRGPIVLVCISRTNEPVAHIQNQLTYMHSQIISILTAGIIQIYDRRPYFDVRSLLGGADRFLDSLASLMDHDASFLLNAIHCLRLESTVRSAVANVMQSAQNSDLLYSILLSGHQLVNLIRPKRYVLQPSDLHLIINFVHASTAFRGGNESWTPLCLPKFNDSGFLHSYVCFIAPDICLLLLSTKQDSFYELSTCKNLIVQGLNKSGLMDTIVKAYQKPDYSVSDLGIPSLLHFLYKSKGTCQFTCPRLEAPYMDGKEQKRLYRIYQRAHKKTHLTKKAHKVYYQVSSLETVIAWVTAGFELFAVFNPLESKATCIKACNDILKWIKNEEGSLFILNSPVW